MFCIDYPLSHTGRSRQIVFLINIEETVSESNRGQPGVQRHTFSEGYLQLELWGRQQNRQTQRPVASTMHTLYDKPHYRDGLSNCSGTKKVSWECVQSNNGRGSRNISSIVTWIKPGRKSISSGWLCSGAQPKQRSVYFECLSTSFIQAQIHFRHAVDTFRYKTRTR